MWFCVLCLNVSLTKTAKCIVVSSLVNLRLPQISTMDFARLFLLQKIKHKWCTEWRHLEALISAHFSINSLYNSSFRFPHVNVRSLRYHITKIVKVWTYHRGIQFYNNIHNHFNQSQTRALMHVWMFVLFVIISLCASLSLSLRSAFFICDTLHQFFMRVKLVHTIHSSHFTHSLQYREKKNN